MDESYAVARPEHVAAWLALERQHVEMATTPSLPRYQAMFEARSESLRRTWTAAQGTGAPLDGLDLPGMIEGMRVALGEECWTYETSRRRAEEEAPAALAALREQVPPDPDGGHRPVILGSAYDVEERYQAVGCLDCDWIWVWDSGDVNDTARRHRASHLEPPAWALCEECALPRAMYVGLQNTTNHYRRTALDPETATDAWPQPAIGLVHLWWERQGPYLHRVCAGCLDSLDEWVAKGEDQGLHCDGTLHPPGQELVGNPVRPFQGPGAELDELLRDQG